MISSRLFSSNIWLRFAFASRKPTFKSTENIDDDWIKVIQVNEA